MKPNYLKSIGWAGTVLGCAIWTYGYFVPGNPANVSWPGWAATYLPNRESEVGMVLMLLAMVPLYWRSTK